MSRKPKLEPWAVRKAIDIEYREERPRPSAGDVIMKADAFIAGTLFSGSQRVRIQAVALALQEQELRHRFEIAKLKANPNADLSPLRAEQPR